MPSRTLASDNFNRADGAIGSNWAGVVGNFVVHTNFADASDLSSDAVMYWNAITFQSDQYAQCALYNLDGDNSTAGFGVCLRASTSVSTFYRIVVSAGVTNNVEVSKFVNGVYTQLALRTQAFADGDILRAEIHGSTIQIYHNSVQMGADITDSSIATGQPGIAYSGALFNGDIDNWEGGDFAAGATPLVYDVFQRADENPIAGNWVTAGPSSTGMQIIGNALWGGGGPSEPSVSLFEGTPFDDDQWVQWRVGTTNSSTDDTGMGCVLRGSTAGGFTGYVALVNANNKLSIGKYVSGTYTSIAVISTTVGNGDIVRLQVIGSTLRAYVGDGVSDAQVGSDMVDTSIASGYPGAIRKNSSGNNMHDFTAGDFLGPTVVSVTNQIDCSAASGSVSVTVPAGATAALLFWAHYNNLGASTLSTKTLGGNAFTTQEEIACKTPASDNTGTGVAYLTNLPAAGSQTFAWAWSDADARDEGGGVFIVFLTDVNIADWIRSSDTDTQSGGGIPHVSPAGVIVSDGVFILVQSFTQPDIFAVGNILYYDLSTVNSEHYAIVEVCLNQSMTDVDYDMGGGDYSTLAAIAIKREGVVVEPPEAGDAGPTLIRLIGNRQTW